MKEKNWRGLDASERTSISTVLADAANRALRTARVAGATRWGARALWWGGVGVGAFAWRFEVSATAGKAGVAIVLLTLVCVLLSGRLNLKSGRRGRRALALRAARRLEQRFPEHSGVFVAAVDFCEEEAGGSFETSKATSAALRAATVATATRLYNEIASTLDEAELNAVLTGTPFKRFQQKGKMRRLFALGVLVNTAIWGSWGVWGERCNVESANSCSMELKIGETLEPVGKKGRNGGSKENREKGENEGRGEKEGDSLNKGIEEDKNRKVDEAENGEDGGAEVEISFSTLETLISELAQNAEIAEFLKAELEKGAAVETETAGEGGTKSDATQLLQAARELEANLTRPATGLVAQTRRLKEAARREWREIESRWSKIGAFEGNKGNGGNKGNVKEGEAGEIGEISQVAECADETFKSARHVSGREIAVFLILARLEELETKLTSSGGVADLATLELSRILRSERAAERKGILADAVACVGEWGALLRREEASARILSESWRFDATSQSWRETVSRVKQENKGMLTRFAGRMRVEIGASDGGDGEFEEAKERLNACWSEAQIVEGEGIAIVERLRERLQREESQAFIDFIARERSFAGLGELLNDDADEAVVHTLNDAASRMRKRNAELTQHIENNCFGIAGESWRDFDAPFLGGWSPILLDNLATEKTGKGGLLSVAVKGVGGGGESASAEERGSAGASEERRFSALAALLTWGIDVETNNEVALQVFGNKEDGTVLGDGDNDLALLEGKAEGTQANAAQNDGGEIEEQNSETTEKGVGDATSRNTDETENGKETKSQKTVDGDVNAEKDEGWKGRGSEKEGNANFGNEPNANGGEEANGENASANGDAGKAKRDGTEGWETIDNKAFNGELPEEARRRFEGTSPPEILPEYAEKIRLYRRRILEEKR